MGPNEVGTFKIVLFHFDLRLVFAQYLLFFATLQFSGFGFCHIVDSIGLIPIHSYTGIVTGCQNCLKFNRIVMYSNETLQSFL